MKKSTEIQYREYHMKGRSWRAISAAALSLLFACLVLAGCASGDFRMLTAVGESYPSASKCGKCHIEIYEEWKQSDHSRSYSDDAFRLASNEYSFDDCLGCHSPISIHGDGAPATRSAIRDEGVTCVACHFKQGTLTGPIDSTAAIVPHEISVEKDFFTSSALCGTCHQGTYDEWKKADIEDKKNCQECHMPEVTRKVTQGVGFAAKILVGMEEEHKLRRHTFDYRNNDKREETEKREEAVSFEIKWECGEGGCFVEVEALNKLPHFIPTGDFGFRKGVLTMVAKSGDGSVVSQQDVELFKETRTALKPGERRTFRFSAPGNTSRVEITLKREGANEADRYVIGSRAFDRDETDR